MWVCAPAVHLSRDRRLFQGHTVLSVLLCSVFSSLMCSVSALSTAGSKYSWGRGFAPGLCHMELNALIQPGRQSASDLSLRPLGLMPHSWTWWSNSFYSQLSCSFEEESPWLLMSQGTVDCGCTQTPSVRRGRTGQFLLCSCGRATPTGVYGQVAFPVSLQWLVWMQEQESCVLSL